MERGTRPEESENVGAGSIVLSRAVCLASCLKVYIVGGLSYVTSAGSEYGACFPKTVGNLQFSFAGEGNRHQNLWMSYMCACLQKCFCRS